MPGDELAKLAAQACRGIRILLTSGYARATPNGTAVRGIPVLRKPYRQEELAHAIRAALDREASVPQPGFHLPAGSAAADLGSSRPQA